jgi:hypothetical protein
LTVIGTAPGGEELHGTATPPANLTVMVYPTGTAVVNRAGGSDFCVPSTSTFPPVSGQHLPRRPQWTCRVCAADWPCQTAIGLLAAEMTRTPMCVYLAAYLIDAIVDLPDVPIGVLYLRFLQPARRQPATFTSAGTERQ